MSVTRFILVLPTLNAAATAAYFIRALKSQSLQPDCLLVLDSHSTDNTRDIFKRYGADIVLIEPSEFDHGATRQRAVDEYAHSADILVFMTQDALFANETSLEILINAFEDQAVAAAYGRQLPRKQASPIEAHARIFNYPPETRIKALQDSEELGIKTCFMSNSFAAYRCTVLKQIGGFPENNIVSEETYVGAKMLEAGWKIKYCAESMVYHSHNYTMIEELQRYFDLGVFHCRQPWIRSRFGQAEGEGKRFVLSELAFVRQARFFLIPSVLLRTVFKYLGFRLGLSEAYLPNQLKICLSMQNNYWKKR